jgi:hypothetical protein
MTARTREEKLVLLCEAAKRTLVTFDRMHDRLWRQLRELSPRIADVTALDEVSPEIYIDCMGLVDAAHRFGQLVDAMPLISKKAPQIRLLQQAVANIEEARNHLQHLRGELVGNAPIDYPILGSLSWAIDDGCYVLGFSQPGAQIYSLVYDREERRWMNQLVYRVKQWNLDLDKTRTQLHAAFDWLRTQLATDPPHILDPSWTHSVGMRLTWQDIDPASG